MRKFILSLVAAMVFTAARASGQSTLTWDGSTGDYFSDHWGGSTPALGDTLVVNAGSVAQGAGDPAIVISNSSADGQQLNIGGGSVTVNGTAESFYEGQSLNIEDGGALNVTGGVLNANVLLGASNEPASATFSGGTVSGNLTIAQNASVIQQGNATVNASVTFGATPNFGNSSLNSSYTLAGGTLNGNASGSSFEEGGTLNVTGGTLAGGVNLGTMNVSGGEIDATSIDCTNFSWTGGAIYFRDNSDGPTETLGSEDTLTVSSGCVLGGEGRVTVAGTYATSIASGGLVEPGSASTPGPFDYITLGNMVFSTGSIFQERIASTTEYGQLGSNNTIDLTAQPTLQLDLSYAPQLGDQFEIIEPYFTGAGAVSGQFEGLPQGSIFDSTYGGQTYQFQIDYASQSVTLTVVPEPSSVVLVAVGLIPLLMKRCPGSVKRSTIR